MHIKSCHDDVSSHVVFHSSYTLSIESVERGVGRRMPGILRSDCITSIGVIADVGGVKAVVSMRNVVEVGVVADASGDEDGTDASGVEVVDRYLGRGGRCRV